MNILLIFVAFLFPVMVFLFFRKIIVSGSDHYYHSLLINLIRRNRFRFATKHTNFINENIVSYPQLLHWLFSFFSDRFIFAFSPFLGLFFQVIQILGFWFFLVCLNRFQVVQLSGMQISLAVFAFSFIPYTYFVSNAKNTGLSARGMGLFFGQVLLYGFVLKENLSPLLFYALTGITGLLIILSSQFATQFLVFFSVIFSLVSLDFAPFISLLLSFVSLFVLFPKYGRNMMLGQWRHKVLYSKYLASIYILKKRPSVWLDLFVEIPSQFILLLKKRVDKLKTDHWNYIFDNPVIIGVFFIPALLVFLFSKAMGVPGHFSELIFCSLIIYLLTTLKPLRFLGEPERYLEFVFPLLVINVVLLLSVNQFIILTCYSAFVLLFYFLIQYKNRSRNINGGDRDRFNEQALFYEGLVRKIKEKNNARVFCNSTEISKFLFDPDIQMFYYPVNSLSTDVFSFSKVYSESYARVNVEIVPDLIRYYQLNTLIIEAHQSEIYEDMLKADNFDYFIENYGNSLNLIYLSDL